MTILSHAACAIDLLDSTPAKAHHVLELVSATWGKLETALILEKTRHLPLIKIFSVEHVIALHCNQQRLMLRKKNLNGYSYKESK